MDRKPQQPVPEHSPAVRPTTVCPECGLRFYSQRECALWCERERCTLTAQRAPTSRQARELGLAQGAA